MSDKFSRVTIDVDIQTNTIHSQVIYMPALKGLSIHYDTGGLREGVNIIMKNFREVTPRSLVDTLRFRSNLFLQSPTLNLLPPLSLHKNEASRTSQNFSTHLPNYTASHPTQSLAPIIMTS